MKQKALLSLRFILNSKIQKMEQDFENSGAQIVALKTEFLRVDFYKRLHEICAIINCSGNRFENYIEVFNENCII